MAITQPMIDRTKQFEGSVAHMYLDTNDNVTVGVGHLLAADTDAAGLPFVRKNDGQSATTAEKKADWTNISNQESGHVASYYDTFATVRLKQSDIDALLAADLAVRETQIKTQFTGYDTYPAAAQEGLMDMVFNLGLSKVVNGFPSFTAAVRAQDWATAADECKRNGVSAARNATVKALFESLAAPILP